MNSEKILEIINRKQQKFIYYCIIGFTVALWITSFTEVQIFCSQPFDFPAGLVNIPLSLENFLIIVLILVLFFTVYLIGDYKIIIDLRNDDKFDFSEYEYPNFITDYHFSIISFISFIIITVTGWKGAYLHSSNFKWFYVILSTLILLRIFVFIFKAPKNERFWSGLFLGISILIFLFNSLSYRHLSIINQNLAGNESIGKYLGNLTNRDYNKIKIEQSNLSNSKIDNSEFNHGKLNDCNFENAVFSRNKLQNVSIVNSNFNNSKFKNVIFDNSIFSDSTYNYASTFVNSQFKDVSFKKCKLQKVDFSNSKFVHVDFHDAKLEQTNFFGCDLSTCHGLTLDMLRVAKTDSTILPNEIVKQIYSNENNMKNYKCWLGKNKAYTEKLKQKGFKLDNCN